MKKLELIKNKLLVKIGKERKKNGKGGLMGTKLMNKV